MDNLKVKVSEVHVRVEHYLSAVKLGNQEPCQSSFGILVRSFEVNTTDRDGVEIFHDRSQTTASIFKKVCLEGLAVYLNPID